LSIIRAPDPVPIVEVHRAAERGRDLQHVRVHSATVVIDASVDLIVALLARLSEEDAHLIRAGFDCVVDVLAQCRSRVVVAHVSQGRDERLGEEQRHRRILFEDPVQHGAPAARGFG
jgi:hypothetical protein